MKDKYSKENLEKLCKISKSINDLCNKLGLRVSSGNFNTIRKQLMSQGIKTNFKIGNVNIKTKDVVSEFMYKIEDYLDGKILPHSGYKFKLRLIKKGWLEEKCIRCGITEWEGEKLSLHMDHIDGNRYNNELKNLRLLCPNCHSLTPTYCGKNKKQNYMCPCGNIMARRSKQCSECRLKSIKSKTPNNECLECNVPIRTESKRCKKCYLSTCNFSQIKPPKKIDWPPIETILLNLETKSYTKYARELGVSDNAIRKNLRYNKVKIPRKHKKVAQPTTGD